MYSRMYTTSIYNFIVKYFIFYTTQKWQKDRVDPSIVRSAYFRNSFSYSLKLRIKILHACNIIDYI
jgi:hypothetical protein